MSVKKGLGKGIGALFPDSHQVESEEMLSGVVELDINKIEPNANQPRKTFEESALYELSESIKQFGIIQPIVVKKETDFYSIIAGERRWRAARLARLDKVPVVIKDFNEIQVLQVALIENIQRADLNLIEEAVCYKRLSEDFSFTQEEISEKVGKSRSHISNSMRLLKLEERVQQFVSENKISMGHAKLMLPLSHEEQIFVAEAILEDDLSVRDTEKLLVSMKESVKQNNVKKPITTLYRTQENELKQILGTKVMIKDGKNKGKIEIEYYSSDELDRLLSFFKKNLS